MFRFRFERILVRRVRVERSCEIVYADALRAERAESSRIAALEVELVAARGALQTALRAGSAAARGPHVDAFVFVRHLGTIEQRIAQRRLGLASLMSATAAARRDLEAARAARRGLQRLRAVERQRYDLVAERRDAAAYDDAAIVRTSNAGNS